MNYKLVETFAVLGRTLSVTKTAEKLFLSQSAVSHRLKKLEEELGTTLIVRSKGFKKIKLTDQGEVFKSIALDWEEINDKIKHFSLLSSNKKLTIGIVDSVNNYLFRDIYHYMSEKLNVQMTVKTEHTREIYDQISARIIDVGFVLHNIPFDQIECKTILEETMVLVTKNPKIINLNCISPDMLNFEEQIFINWGDEYLKWHHSYFSSKFNPKLVLDSTLLALSMLNDHLWIIVPISATKNLPEKVRVVTFDQNPPTRKIYMVSNKMPLHSNKNTVEDFKETVSSHMKSQLDK